eukprot:CAMPEP_0197005940 /NCGR_PEP_ID=MMETSP1380-20130617/32218_1 /TAXON_ID=5936 /ORGANISM="Euplotes crassus, Strain CT5" /LENGTH=218 /DNA_ID=CAMNT_0042425299 /DNA_START=137 /DNA_END=794 /DNA_ORIENTATION=+
MINQNQESEASLEETRNKLKNEINKRQAEVDKYRENMDFLDNQSKAMSVVDASTIVTYKPPGEMITNKDSRDKLGIDKVEDLVNEIFDSIVPKHIATKEMDMLTKLQKIEGATQELLDMRSNLMKYGDLNLLNDIRELENLLDRNRKQSGIKKRMEEEKQDKIKKQLKSQQRAEKTQANEFKGRKPQYRASKPKLSNGKKGKIHYSEKEADLMRYVYG